MMDTEEMYERGRADAEQGAVNPFYYQHYYQYRRGYDEVVRQLRRSSSSEPRFPRWLIVVVTIVLVVSVGGVALVRLRARPLGVVILPTATAQVTRQPTFPVRSPIFPTATLQPTRALLHVGGLALVTNVEGNVLRGRESPRLTALATATFRQGERVRILEGPVQADGYVWWRIESASDRGWSAERSSTQVIWLLPLDG